ncbi:UNVERIFIED_CONTAM: hypothetical protein Slati_1168500 [Sesamum latifolium]|uniref:Retrovirus-related Pol polyprotein from transposon TNT 1-94-like beta-barrel domain-containing protein n=1 Tax=Sesamum latifolium TaxID=2727402 RepID=A0AAW2XFB7_9LAMI
MENGSSSSMKMMNQDFVKLVCFDGSNYPRWKDKMMFLLTFLKVAYVLDPNQPAPEAKENESNDAKAARLKREEDELLCRGHILNTLSDRLFDLYASMKSPLEIWYALENKYNTEKQGTDKFLFLKYFEFAMRDNMSLMDQVHELQIYVSKLKDLKVEIPEAVQVGAIIAKLPMSWNNYRKKLLHSTEDFSVDQLLKHLRIEEETCVRDKVHGVQSSSKKGHIKKDCRFKKQKKEVPNVQVAEANVDEIVAMVTNWHISFVTELNMATTVQSNDWWYDSGATIHVCNDKNLFKDYEIATEGQKVLMGNANTAAVLGKGSVEVHFTSGKKLLLTNVLHVPEIRKNLVSAALLCKKGLKAVIESDKLIFTKSGVFVGKGYYCDGMFKFY